MFAQNCKRQANSHWSSRLKVTVAGPEACSLRSRILAVVGAAVQDRVPFESIEGQLEAMPQMKLLEDADQMRFDRFFADKEPIGHLFVAEPGSHESRDLRLPLAQELGRLALLAEPVFLAGRAPPHVG